MNSAQQNYTTTEKELLSVVETLKEFRNILLGHHISVYTDHKNLAYNMFNTERVMRWRLILKEFGPELKYIKGENNVVADVLSRLEMTDNQDILNISELYGNIVITNWISTIRQIRIIVSIELRDVEYLLIVTHFKVRESVGYDVVFTLIYLSLGPKSSSIRRQRITRSVFKKL